MRVTSVVGAWEEDSPEPRGVPAYSRGVPAYSRGVPVGSRGVLGPENRGLASPVKPSRQFCGPRTVLGSGAEAW